MKLDWNPPTITVKDAIISWSADHAEDVHEGAVYMNGARGIARPFAIVAIALFDFEQAMLRGFLGSNSLSVAFMQTVEAYGEKILEVIESYDWGIESDTSKTYRSGSTWVTIADSGDLGRSQEIEFS
jgi:hypothetical protein